MSNLEKDLNPDTFIGISLPLEYGVNGFFNQTRTTLRQVAFNIQNLLLTQKGERLGNPRFGSNLLRVVFEPDNTDIQAKVEEAIRTAMSEFLSFVNIVSIDVKTNDLVNNMINVKINFTVDFDQNIQTVGLNLGPEAPFNEYDTSTEGLNQNPLDEPLLPG